MPVIATPALAPRAPQCGLPEAPVTPTPVSCAGQFILSPAQGYSRGQPVLTRTQAVKIFGGSDATFDWVMRDQDGNPIDLTDCLCDAEISSSDGSVEGCPYAIVFRMMEYLCLTHATSGEWSGFETEVTLTGAADAAAGKVRVTIPAANTQVPGVYFGQLALLKINSDNSEVPVFGNTFYLYIERGAWSAGRHIVGPPSIAEVRMHLRDSSSNESYLLDNLRFDDAEIANAAALAVQQWNETPPPVKRFTTQNFPYRYHWLHAICGHLFLSAAEQFRANNLSYSAAGVQVDDQNKEPNYERAAQARLGLWNSFVKQKKVEINMSLGWGTFGSPYGY
jgi:hypothetical protein